MDPLIEITSVAKRFGTTRVLRDISLLVRVGESCALLGENGAGKSTLLAILAGILRPDAGTVRICGANPGRRGELVTVSHRMGVVLPRALLYPQLSVLMNLKLFASLYGVAGEGRVEQLLEEFGLTAVADKLVSELSQGLMKRVSLARSMVQRPELLIWDEPFTHLDVDWKDEVSLLINRHAAAGGAVLFSSHEPELIARSSTRAVTLSGGSLAEKREASEALYYAG